MEQAARDLVSEISKEVEERCRTFEARLQDELDQKHRSLRAELIGDVSKLGESCQRTCTDLEEDLSARLRSLEARVGASEAEAKLLEVRVGKSEAELPSLTQVVTDADQKSRETSELLEKLESKLKTTAEEVGTLTSKRDEMEKRMQGLEEARTHMKYTTAKMEELRELCDRRFSGMQERLEQLVHTSSVAVGAPELEGLERICSTHMSATREAIKEIFATIHDVQAQLATVNKGRGVQANAGVSVAQEDQEDILKQMQALREQHLNLSMRISEMQMRAEAETPAGSPTRGGGLGDDSIQVRAEVDHQRQLVQAIEQNVERTALNGKAAIKGLDTRVTRLQAQLTGTQQQLREELTVLLEELRKSRIIVDNHRFPSLSRVTPSPGVVATPTESVGSTVPSTPDRTPFLTSGRSPVDFGGSSESAAPAVRDKKVSEKVTEKVPDDDACSIM